MPLARRALLKATLALPFLAGPLAARASSASLPERFAALERQLEGRLGVFAIDTASELTLGYRADESFAFASSFKAILGGAVLARSQGEPGLLQRRIHYSQAQLVNYSPITQPRLASGMTVEALCAAAIQYSDNTAANQLLALIGGPAGLTRFAREQQDATFRLDRNETRLNTAIPGDPRDTSTPMAMARLLRRLALGDGLGAAQRAQLQAWLKGNTTGDRRIRAGVPPGWPVGDKTGTGDYGSASDLGLVWPPGRAPWVIAVYTARGERDAAPREAVIAEATRLIVGQWA
jgi:beta-lactamase class A